MSTAIAVKNGLQNPGHSFQSYPDLMKHYQELVKSTEESCRLSDEAAAYATLRRQHRALMTEFKNLYAWTIKSLVDASNEKQIEKIRVRAWKQGVDLLNLIEGIETKLAGSPTEQMVEDRRGIMQKLAHVSDLFKQVTQMSSQMTPASAAVPSPGNF